MHATLLVDEVSLERRIDAIAGAMRPDFATCKQTLDERIGNLSPVVQLMTAAVDDSVEPGGLDTRSRP